MASLANQTISSSYDGLIKTSSDNAVGVSGVQLLQDGSGNDLALSVGRSGNGVTITGSLNATLATAAQPNITSVGTLSSLTVAGELKTTQGTDNTIIGANAGNLATTTGERNVGIGNTSLFAITSGSNNVAVGQQALNQITTGTGNVAVGRRSLVNVTTGVNNIGIGVKAGDAITTGSNNTIIGDIAGTGGLSDTIILGAGTTERLRIDSSGNVGIGTSSPDIFSRFYTRSVGIDSSGITKIQIDGATYTGIDFGVNGTRNGEINNTSTGFGINTIDARPITLTTNSGERMRITSAGDVLVGATALSEVNNIVDGHLLESNSQTAGNGAVGVYNNSGTANCPALVVLNRDTSTDSSNRFVQFYANVTDSGATAMGGIVGNGASNVQFASLSDEREKENITEISGSLDKIMQLQVSEFDWISSGEHIGAGFIAQNVETVFPEYVIENVSGEGEEARKGITGGMSAGYIAHLTKAIQELKAEIESLKNK